MRASTLLSWVALWALGFFRTSVQARTEGCGSGSSLTKTWAQFKAHFSAAHRQHKQMQGESAATAGYHSANADVGQT
jgi:hypothetical protein